MAYDASKPLNTGYLADAPAELRENFRALKEDQIVDAGKLSGFEVGHSSGSIPVADGTVVTNLNADLLDGHNSAYFSVDGHVHDTATATSGGFLSSTDKVKLDGIATAAEVNQNAFSNVSINGTVLAADTKQDTLELAAGTGITITPDATNDKVTFAFTSGANVDIGGSSASCTGNASSATKLATGRTIRVNLGSNSAESFDGTANITPGVTGVLPVANGGTGNSSGSVTCSSFLGIRSDDWRSHNGYFSLYKYENSGTVLPNTYCIVLSAKQSASRGAAIAIDWRQGGSGIWYTGLHDDTGANNWGSWKGLAPLPTTSAGVGQIGNAVNKPASVSLPSGGTYYYIFQADKDGLTTRFESGIASGGTQIAINDSYTNNLRLVYIRLS